MCYISTKVELELKQSSERKKKIIKKATIYSVFNNEMTGGGKNEKEFDLMLI